APPPPDPSGGERARTDAPRHGGPIPAEMLERDGPRPGIEKLDGAVAPPLVTEGDWINGSAVTVDSLKGKIVVVDFWATWCGPCLASVPKNNDLARKYKDQDVVFIGICHTRGAEKMAETVKSKGIQYPVVADSNGKTMEAYLVDS